MELDLLVPCAARESRHYLLPVEVFNLLAGLGFPLQGLLQQVVGLGRCIVGILGDLLDLVGVRLVSEVRGKSERAGRQVRTLLTRLNAGRKCVSVRSTHLSASARASSASSVMLLGSPPPVGGLMSCRWGKMMAPLVKPFSLQTMQSISSILKKINWVAVAQLVKLVI